MSSNNQNNSTLSLRSVLEKDKLNGTNFLDWHRNLRIVLKQERKIYVLEEPVPDEPLADAARAVKNAYEKHKNDSIDVACLMLATMNSELQKDLELLEAYDIIASLKEMFQQQARQERYETIKALHSCKMAEGAPVSPYILKMKGYIDHLERLGFPLIHELATDLILNSLPESYDQFVMNFNMNNMEKSISELHAMLKTAEQNIKTKPSHILMVRNGHVKKKNGKGKGKGKGKAKQGKSKAPLTPKTDSKPKTLKEGICFFHNVLRGSEEKEAKWCNHFLRYLCYRC
ncbi:retrotransposon gag domain-containing protein [Weizmannia coagulans]|nr:retrotransposon gag domain-containing protein [Heyndrickxia coagulans]